MKDDLCSNRRLIIYNHVGPSLRPELFEAKDEPFQIYADFRDFGSLNSD